MHLSPPWLTAPFRWVSGKVRKHYVDRDQLIREGSQVVTPAIACAEAMDVSSVLYGSEDEVTIRLLEQSDTIKAVLSDLQTYLNAHPSEEIRIHGQEAVDLLDSVSGRMWLLASGVQADDVGFREAIVLQHQTRVAMKELMQEIRDY